MALVAETLEDLKGRLEAWKGAFESKGLRVHFKKTKIMISSEKAEKVAIEVKFHCAVCREGVGINSILCPICRYWLHKRCGGTRGKLKEDNKFKCKIYANQLTEIAEDCPDIVINGQSLEIAEYFCYVGDTIGARGGAFDSVMTRIRSRWCTLVPFSASRSMPVGAKDRLYSASLRSIMLYASEIWQVRQADVIKLNIEIV